MQTSTYYITGLSQKKPCPKINSPLKVLKTGSIARRGSMMVHFGPPGPSKTAIPLLN